MVRQVPVLGLRMRRLPGWSTGAEDGDEAEKRVRNDAANRGKVVEHEGWRTGSSGLFLPPQMAASRERIAGFVRRLLVEILPTAGAQPILPPIPALKVPLTAETGRESSTGGRGRRFMTHEWSFPDVAISPSTRPYGAARGWPPRSLPTAPDEWMTGDWSFDECPRRGADRPTNRGPTPSANGSTTQGPLLPGCHVRTSRADHEDEDRADGETL